MTCKKRTGRIFQEKLFFFIFWFFWYFPKYFSVTFKLLSWALRFFLKNTKRWQKMPNQSLNKETKAICYFSTFFITRYSIICCTWLYKTHHMNKYDFLFKHYSNKKAPQKGSLKSLPQKAPPKGPTASPTANSKALMA